MCWTRSSHRNCPLHDRLYGNKYRDLICEAKYRGFAHAREIRKREKLCLLRGPNFLNTSVKVTLLRRWRGRQVWSTEKTERWKARTSVILKSSGERMSWKAGISGSRSIGRSRSDSLFISWQRRECSSSITIFWICILIAAISSRFRWTRTATKSQSLLIGLGTSVARSCVQNLRQQSDSALYGTIGAVVRLGC